MKEPTKVCAVCCINLYPQDPNTMTAHEFGCFKVNQDLIPVHLRSRFVEALQWERRSNTAKRAALKRKQGEST